MAIAHWLVAVWEDHRSSNFLSAGLGTSDHGLADPNSFLLQAYLVHHLAAACCFGAVLALQSCTGLATFGLIFELPVLLMNHREFVIYADTMPKWFLEYDRVDFFWDCLNILFGLARGGASLVYLYSLIFWLDDVAALPWPELLVYHSMAIFFTIVNCTMGSSFLGFWSDADRTKAAKSEDAASEDAPGEAVISCGAADEGREEQPPPAPESVDDGKRLVLFREDFLEERRAAGKEDGEVFMEIDGVCYNVKDFLDKHPGGAAVLRKHADRDASESFHRVRHSMNAKRMMQQYAEGAIVKRPRSYRIFEHLEEQLRVLQEAAVIFAAYGLAALLLPRSAFAVAGRGAPLAVALVPGLLLAAMGGAWALLCTYSRLADGLSPGAGLITVYVLLHIVALSLARDPWSIDNPTCPTAIEIGAWMVFLIEEVGQLWRYGARGWLGRILITFGFLLASWAMRGIEAASCVVGVLLGAATAALCHRASDGRPRQQVASEIYVGAALASPCSALALYYLSTTDPAVMKALDAWWPTSLISFCTAELIAILVFLALGCLLNNTHICTAIWASRCWSIALSLAAGLAGGVSSWRWLAWLAWLWHVTTLGNRLAEQHAEHILNDTFKDLHPYQVGTRALFDLARTVFASATWAAVVKPVKFIVNAVLPEEFRLFAMPMPFFDFGDGVDLGVAAHFAPAAAALATKGPQHFECNVGHVDLQHPSGDGVLDLHRSMNTLRDSFAEFRRPATGLLADVVCFFPGVQGTGVAKQIRLSLWQSSDDAQAWHAKSSAHKDAQRRLADGLRTGSSLAAELRPQGKIRHQDRCKDCLRNVEAERLGEHAPRNCRVCGGRTFGYPFF